jgi:hypothetical protein
MTAATTTTTTRSKTVTRARLIVAGVLAAVGFSLLGAGTAEAFQTHMWNANGDLLQAQSELNQAIPDKAGHRIAALNLIQQALDQVNLGIQAGAQ